MAVSMSRDFGLSEMVSSIRILRGAGQTDQVVATSGQLTNLIRRIGSLEFNWQAKSLPWVFPDRKELDERVMALSNRVDLQSLEIHGLMPGKYTLNIDGTDVGTYDNSELEHHIELQANSTTAQYQQALAVAKLNQLRNEGPINALLDEWWSF